jgi:hypothetical protein
VRAAIRALTDFAAAQGAVLVQLSVTETFDTVDVACPLTDLNRALTLSSLVVTEGGTVTLVLVHEGDDEDLRLQSMKTDEWTSDGALDLFYPELSSGERPDRWVTADFTEHPPSVGFRARAAIRFEKAQWRDPLSEETGRAVWIGISQAAFVAWLREGSWTGPLSRLFGKPGALVLLGDWTGDAVKLGDRLSIGSLETSAGIPPPASPWPEQVPPEMRCMLDVRVDQLAGSSDLTVALAGLLGAAAAWLLGEERDSTWSRPSRRSSTSWSIGTDPSQSMTTADAIVELARWVQNESNITRLAIAREIAARRIPTLADAKAREPVLDAADIAYYTAIDDSVQRALQTQLELERSFQDLDGKLADLRATLRQAVDQTMIRALTASLGIAVATLTVARARGWPTVLAAEAVAAYVLFTAWWSLTTMHIDLTSRLDALRDLVRDRAVGLGISLGSKIDGWKRALKRRVIFAQVVLTFIAAVVGIGGAVLGGTIARDERPRGGVQTPTSPTPSR